MPLTASFRQVLTCTVLTTRSRMTPPKTSKRNVKVCLPIGFQIGVPDKIQAVHFFPSLIVHHFHLQCHLHLQRHLQRHLHQHPVLNRVENLLRTLKTTGTLTSMGAPSTAEYEIVEIIQIHTITYSTGPSSAAALLIRETMLMWLKMWRTAFHVRIFPYSLLS